MEQKIEKRKRKKQDSPDDDCKSSSLTIIDNYKKKDSSVEHTSLLFSLLLSLPKGRYLELMETFVNSFEFYLFISPHIINYIVPKKNIKRKATKLIDKLSKVIIFLRFQVVLFKILKIVALFKDKKQKSSNDEEESSNAIELIDKASKNTYDIEIERDTGTTENNQSTTANIDAIAETKTTATENGQAQRNDLFEQAWNRSTDNGNQDGSMVITEAIPNISSENINDLNDQTVVDKKEQINQLAIEIAVELFDLVCLWKNISFIDMVTSMFGTKKPAKEEKAIV